MANSSNGLLYKKIIDEDGNVSSTLPFLLRTWAGYVFGSDGKSIESKITEIDNTIAEETTDIDFEKEW
jgi:hypothetical protein